MPCETHAKIEKPVQIHFTTLRIPIASMRSANGYLLLEKLRATLQIGFHSIPRPVATNLKKQPPPLTPFRPCVRIKGGHTDPSVSREAKPRASLLRIHLRPFRPRPFHLFKGRVPSSPPQWPILDTETTKFSTPKPSHPFGIAPKIIIKRPMVTVPPIEARASGFIWITLEGAQSPTAIYFSIDGCQGILEARHIAEALHIPYQPDDPAHFK
ncbi:hypothetical protein CK203_063665 [Vitis vinifera]|uniref:Uncharacterized protein n=1 Tax=Vitis vinifera TaxID=29760 RepID=A0A438G7U4_VITVI|nr:hypothetical protein CK203_063665 [Vitis vinifera]